MNSFQNLPNLKGTTKFCGPTQPPIPPGKDGFGPGPPKDGGGPPRNGCGAAAPMFDAGVIPEGDVDRKIDRHSPEWARVPRSAGDEVDEPEAGEVDLAAVRDLLVRVGEVPIDRVRIERLDDSAVERLKRLAGRGGWIR